MAAGLYLMSASLVVLTVSAGITLTTQKNRRPPGRPAPHYHATMTRVRREKEAG